MNDSLQTLPVSGAMLPMPRMFPKEQSMRCSMSPLSTQRESSDGALEGYRFKTTAPEIPDGPVFVPLVRASGDLFASLIEPVTSRSGQKVGVIRVFDNVTGEQDVLHQSAVFQLPRRGDSLDCDCGDGSRFSQTPAHSGSLVRANSFPEGKRQVEFKSSLRWSYQAAKSDPEVERAVIKTVAGLLNSYRGGNLIIGLSDDGRVLGLQPDYSTLKTRPNRDGFEQALRNILINAFGESPCAAWVNVNFCSVDNKDLCVVKIRPATEPIYPKQKGIEDSTLYVRLGNTTTPLSALQAVAYARERWGGVSLHHSYFRRSTVQPAA
jgi:hypothetical protein